MTTARIDLSESDDLAAALKAKAAAQGLSLEGWFQKIARQEAPGHGERPPKKSAYGLLAKYGPGPSDEDIEDNRRDMFHGFAEDAPRSQASPIHVLRCGTCRGARGYRRPRVSSWTRLRATVTRLLFDHQPGRDCLRGRKEPLGGTRVPGLESRPAGDGLRHRGSPRCPRTSSKPCGRCRVPMCPTAFPAQGQRIASPSAGHLLRWRHLYSPSRTEVHGGEVRT